MTTSFLVFAYFGPETVLPVTSIVATVVGVVMMMGRSSLLWVYSGVKRVLGFCFRRSRSTSSASTPHVFAARAAKQEVVETH
jgi:hypothetical protein